MKNNILFIHPGQFGYHTSTYYYCMYLSSGYTIDYLGLNEYLPNKEIESINYHHLRKTDSSFINRMMLIKYAYRLSSTFNYDFILINYSPLCFIFRLIFPSYLVVEIRSSYIFKNKYRRILYNTILSFEVRLFKSITTISTGITEYLHLPARTVIIPLGGQNTPIALKSFDSIKMLYVGTFVNRNIINTIKAFSIFYRKYGDDIDIDYKIIGFGSKNDIEQIIETIEMEEMEKHIFYLGTVRQPELLVHFESQNVGISYIPLTSYYDFQPPTKTFEYLLSGMVVLGTSTSEHRAIINSTNGILTGETVQEVFSGMVEIYKNRRSYSSQHIRKQSQAYTWETIVKNKLIPYIESNR